MTISLNASGAANARARIAAGEVDKTSAWSFSEADGDALLGPNGDNWEEYEKWFLGVDSNHPDRTKARFRYPFGKGGKVYRSAVVVAKHLFDG